MKNKLALDQIISHNKHDTVSITIIWSWTDKDGIQIDTWPMTKVSTSLNTFAQCSLHTTCSSWCDPFLLNGLTGFTSSLTSLPSVLCTVGGMSIGLPCGLTGGLMFSLNCGTVDDDDDVVVNAVEVWGVAFVVDVTDGLFCDAKVSPWLVGLGDIAGLDAGGDGNADDAAAVGAPGDFCSFMETDDSNDDVSMWVLTELVVVCCDETGDLDVDIALFDTEVAAEATADAAAETAAGGARWLTACVQPAGLLMLLTWLTTAGALPACCCSEAMVWRCERLCCM